MLACVASRRRCGASRYHVGGGDLGHKDLANCRKGRRPPPDCRGRHFPRPLPRVRPHRML